MKKSNDPLRIAVIMAGGAGERFWPLSRRNRPKQLLNLTRPDKTMLTEAIDRIAPLIPAERVLIATSRDLAGPIIEANTGVPPKNVIGEPCKRNTAGCLAFAAAHALARFGDEPVTMAVLTADHAIGDDQLFLETVESALRAAEQHNALVTIGVEPTRIETGYGYIEIAEGAKPAADGIYPVASFREKPDAGQAEQFVSSGRFLWNSGMFFWKTDVFLKELEGASPQHAQAACAMASSLAAHDEKTTDRIFSDLNDISIDFSLMEKTKNVLVARAKFPWDDVGALDALARNWPRDASGNVSAGNPILIDCRDNIVINEAPEIAVAAVGVENLAIIVTQDGVLIIPKNRAQDVKRIVNEMKARNATQL